MLNASQSLTNRAALSAESLSRIPPSSFGWLATMPTGRPPKRAKQVMIFFAHSGFMSKYSPSSTIRRITSYMSYGLAVGLRQDVEQLLVHAVDRVGARRASAAAARSSDGKNERYCLIALDALLVVGHLEVADARLAAVHARAAQLLLGDVLADGRLHEVRPGERHRAAALDHRHEVGQARDVGGAGRAGAQQRRDQRDHAAHHRPARGTGARSRRTASRPPPGCARRRSRAARRTGCASAAPARAGARS